MKKLDYFLMCINAELYRNKDWVIHCFSQTNIHEVKPNSFKYMLIPGNTSYYFINDDGSEIDLEDTKVNEPAFKFWDTIELKKGAIVNLDRDVKSNYGKLLINAIVLVYPLHDKISYINENLTVGNIEKQIANRLTTDPEYAKETEVTKDNPIYVSEYLKFVDAALYMEGFSQLAVPSATVKTMTVDPKILERRKELLEQYKDSLHDPAVVAKIDAELIQMDKDWMKGDLGEGFYNKEKFYNVVRKKTHLMIGYEGGLGVKPDTIPTSLSEGWDLERLPAMVNSLREGSYYRGRMTAEGGYATKTINRLFQNVVLVHEDCGSEIGWSVEITNKNAKDYVGFYYLDKNKKPIEITEEFITSQIGKSIAIRSPQFCKSPDTSFCHICMGKPNSLVEHGIMALASEMTSLFLKTAMKKMHGTSLSVKDYDPLIALT